jgi:hypothetical protein
MVRVSNRATDPAIAWRVRDALATHPLLSGAATAQIHIYACHDSIVLEGWTMDEPLRQMAIRLALRAAGRRPVRQMLRVKSALGA